MGEVKGSSNQPIYKKWWFWAVVVLVIFVAIGVAASGNGINESELANGDFTYSEGPMREIEETIRSRAKEKYEDANITKLQIFDETDDGTDNYTVMVYLDWSRKNKSDTAKDMLKMYSSDLAATIGNENEDVNTIRIYWRIPYLQENGNKVGNGENYWIYTRDTNGMTLKDENWIYE